MKEVSLNSGHPHFLKIRKPRTKNGIITFANFSEYINVADVPDSYPESGGRHFYGTDTTGEAFDQIRHGYKYRDEVKPINDLELLADIDLADNYTRSETGEYFDAGLVSQGQPDVWYDRPFEYVKPEIDVFVNIAWHAVINHNTIVRRGKFILSAIHSLEMLANVNAYFVIIAKDWRGDILKDGYKNLTVFIPAPQPYDLDTFAFMAATPQSLRRIGFSLLNQYTEDNYCGDLKPEMLTNVFNIKPERRAVVFDMIKSNDQDFESDTKEIIEELKEQFKAAI